MQKEPLSLKKILNLDNQAKELGMGGKLSPESDENSYKERIFKLKDYKLEKQKKDY